LLEQALRVDLPAPPAYDAAIRYDSQKEKAETQAQDGPQEAKAGFLPTGIARPIKKENGE
jgi:hypothetical protein